MKRRDLILSALGALAVAGSTRAQAKLRRIGLLDFGSRESMVRAGRYDAFLGHLRTLGYLQDKDFEVLERFAEGKVEQLRADAAELVRLNVDVIVVVGSTSARAAQNATSRIPIVIARAGGDPVRSGFGKSLARPGGNVTGSYVSNIELLPKQLEMLTVVVPKMTRVAVLSNPNNPVHPSLLALIQASAKTSRVEVSRAEAGTVADIEARFGDIARERAGGLMILGDSFFVQQARQIAALALQHRLPMVSTTREYADAGGLIAYGEDPREDFRVAADYVDKIFKGAQAGELPFRRSQRPLLVLNARTFRALKLAVPQELGARADEVIR